VLCLTTTDATNYFYVTSPTKYDCEDFEVSVIADIFTKLVQKITSEFITLEVDDTGIFKVTGNGSYSMSLPVDENGGVIRFPKKYDNASTHVIGTIQLSSIKTILTFNKPSLATGVEFPELCCYYCGDVVATSDRLRLCRTDIKLFDTPMLFTSQLMDLIGSTICETINVYDVGTGNVFVCGNDIIYSPYTEGIDSFPISAIIALSTVEFNHSCKVPRASVLELIDRLSLFVSKYDNKVVRLTFTKDGIMFSNKKSSGVEIIPYVESNNFTDFTCLIDIELFKSQIAAQVNDLVELYYGSDKAIKIVSDNITQIVALAEEEE
jgi:hypothetical protein